MDRGRSDRDRQLSELPSPYRYPAVAARVRAAIAGVTIVPETAELLLLLLGRGGRVLAPNGPAKWPAFVLDVCQALGGDVDLATSAAAAVEFVLTAADVVDDLVDDEWTDSRASAARATNATLALTSLAHRCIGDLTPQLGALRAQLMSDIVCDRLAAASSGEDLDILFETRQDVSEELAREMTRRKSGSLVAMACQLGAAIATDDATILEVVGRFGQHVGAVAQLLNDIGGVKPDGENRGSDLRRRKKTVPIAYALRCAREENFPLLLRWSETSGALGQSEEEELARLIDDLGGLHFTWVVAELHRTEALAALDELARVTARSEVSQLRNLIPPTNARKR